MRGESARPGKRPLRALSASEKMDAIQRVHEGESKASVARDIGVPESTLRGWCKSEHKIRGMARNSSTPDSEAHSPASSSGAANNGLSGNANNLSSEDEGPCTKKSRLDRHDAASIATPYLSASDVSAIEADAKQDKPKIDYVSLMTSMAAGMRPENSSLLLQQLGLLSGTTGTLAKNLLGMTTPSLTSHSAVTGTPVGLVENGLRYTKSTNATAAAVAAAAVAAAAAAGIPPSTNATGLVGMGSSNVVGSSNISKRHGISAIAPTQMDSLSKSSCGRKSLPAAAEAPITPVPASPRKTTDGSSFQRSSGSSGIASRSNGRRDGSGGSTGHNKRVDEALWLWLTQQQQLLGQQSATFNPSVNQQDGSWFWQWYKQCSFPLLASTPVTPSPLARKSPSKARAMLDNVLCNNNNNEEAEKRAANPEDEDAQPQPADDVPATSEEAIEHGDKFFKWLDKCSDPSVTRLQIMQFKYLLDNLKTCRKRSSTTKHSRK